MRDLAKAEDADKREWYLSRFAGFEKDLNGGSPAPVHTLRQEAMQSFAESGFPTSRDEEWRHTNVSALTRIAFHPVLHKASSSPNTADLEPFTFADLKCSQMVFVNGHYSPVLSTSAPLPEGVRATSLARALAEDRELVLTHLGRYTSFREQGFGSLNTAFLQDGAFLFVPENTAVADPIHLLFYSTPGSDPTVSHPRNLIVAGANSEVRVIESYAGTGNRPYLTNSVSEVVAGENASVDHCKIARESASAFHVAALHVVEGRSCRFTSHNLVLGGRLTRNDITTVLNGEGVESTLNGLYLADGKGHVDNHTLIEHVRPNCSSHELYKGVLDGASRGVFRGKILVHQEAQKTDAYQSNQNLLLSREADVTSKPQLEIYADDVKCSHGSTTGRLDPEAIFYLRSRGIGLQDAASLLTRAFAAEVLGRIDIEPVRARLDRLVEAKLRSGR